MLKLRVISKVLFAGVGFCAIAHGVYSIEWANQKLDDLLYIGLIGCGMLCIILWLRPEREEKGDA